MHASCSHSTSISLKKSLVEKMTSLSGGSEDEVEGESLALCAVRLVCLFARGEVRKGWSKILGFRTAITFRSLLSRSPENNFFLKLPKHPYVVDFLPHCKSH